MVGHDGKTGYERHFGKAIKEELLGFGEQVFFRKKKGGYKDLGAR